MASNPKINSFSKTDLENILNLYNLGKLKSYKQIIRGVYPNIDYELQPVFIFTTNKGKFFLKQYHKFNYHISKGFSLIKFLLKKGYPCVKVFYSNKNKPYVKNKGRAFAIFEFISLKDKGPTEKRIYELGKYLGRLHSLAKDFPIMKKPAQDIAYFRNSLRKNYYKLKNAPKRIQKVYEYVKNNIMTLTVPENSPKSVCHEEFTLEHVRFRNQKLVKVIDWDLVARDYMFYDLGTTLVSAFYNNKLNFNFLVNLIRGYNKERKLTPWERDHIFEMLQFGAFKFSIWNLEEVKKWKGHIDYARIEDLMKYNKSEFNERLEVRGY